jgi:hypothetical protein
MSDNKYLPYLVVRFNCEWCRNGERTFSSSTAQVRFNARKSLQGSPQMNDVHSEPKWWTYMKMHAPALHMTADASLRTRENASHPKHQLPYSFFAVHNRSTLGRSNYFISSVWKHIVLRKLCLSLSVIMPGHLELSQSCNECWFSLLDITDMLNPEPMSTQKIWVCLNNILVPTGKMNAHGELMCRKLSDVKGCDGGW